MIDSSEKRNRRCFHVCEKCSKFIDSLFILRWWIYEIKKSMHRRSRQLKTQFIQLWKENMKNLRHVALPLKVQMTYLLTSIGKSGCCWLYWRTFLTPWWIMENSDSNALIRVKSMMCSCLKANSKHLTTKPLGEKCSWTMSTKSLWT